MSKNICIGHLYLVIDNQDNTVHIFDSVSSRKTFLRRLIKSMWSNLYDTQPPSYIKDEAIENFLTRQHRFSCSDTLTAHSELALASLSSKIKQRI